MKTSETQTELVKALLAAWAEFPTITKEKNGQAGNRQFKYAPHDVILEAVRPVLLKNGLLLTHSPSGHELITRLDHVSGEWRESTTPVNKEHANLQSLGIEFTYLRRYATQLMLGIITEEDTDGVGDRKKRSGVNNAEPRKENGALQGPSHSPSRLIFDGMAPEIQQDFRKRASHVEAAMPDVGKAIEIAEMILDDWPDQDRQELKAGLAYLFDSKTRSAMKRHTQVASITEANNRAA